MNWFKRIFNIGCECPRCPGWGNRVNREWKRDVEAIFNKAKKK